MSARRAQVDLDALFAEATSFKPRDRSVAVICGEFIAREAVGMDGHAAAALRAVRRVERQLGGTAAVTAKLSMRGVPRFAGASSYSLDVSPRLGLSIADRVVMATQHVNPTTSARASKHVRDFLDFLIDGALALCT